MTETTPTRKWGISNSTLKLIAIITMFIDHIAAVVIYAMLMQASRGLMQVPPMLWDAYDIMRQIGRVAFPIFCYLLVEGFQRTGDQYRYALRLLGFAFLSEIPFDLALSNVVFETRYQNVMFTLFLGLCVMIVCDRLESLQWNRWLTWLLEVVVMFVGMKVADFLHTDYSGYGVLCIFILYFFRFSKSVQLIQGSAAFIFGEMILRGSATELLAPLGFIPVAFYNGKRGLKLKYVFYLFYPVHLLVLFGVKCWLFRG